MIDPSITSLPPESLAHSRGQAPARMRMGWFEVMRYAWNASRTRLLWGPRLHFLGTRSVLGRKQAVLNPKAVSIGSHVTICDGFVFADLAPGKGQCPKIKIGNGVTILFRFQCNSAESVVINDNVLIASNVLITDSDHILEAGGIPVTRNPNFITRPVVIEQNCWIGQNAVILKGVTVGHDSIIGANSVVTRDIPPYSVAVGNPASVMKKVRGAPHDSLDPGLSSGKEQSWKQ